MDSIESYSQQGSAKINLKEAFENFRHSNTGSSKVSSDGWFAKEKRSLKNTKREL